MRRKWTLRKSFAHFRAKATNPRWSWSAMSKDRKTVVVTMWKDEIRSRRGRLTYGSPPRGPRESRAGVNDRRKHLTWARDRCDGLFRVVITVRRADRAGIADSYPDKTLVMRITRLDEETG